MSRIGNKPITVPAGVEVKLDGQKITVKGPKGTLEKEIHKNISGGKENLELIYEPNVRSFTEEKPEEYFYDVNHLLMWHGRNICNARSPKCNQCSIKEYCDSYSKNN